MASDRTRELARKYLIRRDSRFERESYMPDAFDELVYVLDAFERETRLDEAKREWPAIPRDGKYLTLLQWIQGLNVLHEQRIAELAAQPTPEKERGKP